VIDETKCRRDNWDEDQSTWVMLSNGQQWALKRPWLTIHPIFTNGEPTGHWSFYGYGAELDRLLESIGKEEGIVPFVIRTMALLSKLLRLQYDLDDEQLAEVCVYHAGDPESDRMLRDTINVATGNLMSYAGRGVLLDPKVACGG
jgi:hypothetical protein